MFKYIFFDLDGTLTDSAEGITKCVQYALESRGINVPDLNTLRPFIGPPLIESFMKFYGMTEEEARLCTAKYRERFKDTGIYENKVYPGVPEMLQRLKDAGKKVFLLSNAQALFTAPEISLLGLTKYFDGILLSSDAGVKKPDPAFYEMLLKQYHLDPAECLMTGNDDIADCHGAASAGIASRYVATRQSPKINDPLPENCEKIAAIAELF